MSVAQTTQLIQLILNTCLLMAVAVAWWGITWLRHGAIANQLARARRQASRGDVATPLRSLQRQYQLGRMSVGIMHYVLLGGGGSLLALSLRTLLGIDWLITLSMLLFAAAVGGILLSVSLTLLEFYQGQPIRRYPRRRPKPMALEASPASRRQLPPRPPDRIAS